jgi:hypothetical protein
VRPDNIVQISYQEAVLINVRVAHTVANVYRQISYFKEKAGLRFEIPPAETGDGDALVAIFRFSSGHFAALGTRTHNIERGVELLCASLETEPEVLTAFRRAFPELWDEEIISRDKW